MPKDIFCIYLDAEECERIIAVYEKTGALGSLVTKIRAAYATKGFKYYKQTQRLKVIISEMQERNKKSD